MIVSAAAISDALDAMNRETEVRLEGERQRLIREGRAVMVDGFTVYLLATPALPSGVIMFRDRLGDVIATIRNLGVGG